ncbi:inner membrane protein YhjD [Rhodococcus sp. X156]|uniref:inner membrane protein YhjD n=1 Tax=Rhodococcus sp. X156 TaxID=2499145 RepID=UPI001F49DC48|nr:inner membrane protein YhjD [Rhodococcus sp. X156]
MATEGGAGRQGALVARLQRERQDRPWLDHAVRTGLRYKAQKGDFYAAAITYFSVLALFPLAMVGFAVAAFVLADRPDLLVELQESITRSVPGSLGATINELITKSLASRGAVGVIGLLGALYAGLGWMANLREALTEQWDTQHDRQSFARTKVGDLGALVGLGLALVVSLSLSALGGGGYAVVLRLLGVEDAPGIFLLTALLAIVLSVAATWGVFVWVIARLPREPVTWRSAIRAALLAAVAFEVFKQVGVFYLQQVTGGPAGVTFGPIIGILVFFYVTSRLVLFATAWAATARENQVLLATTPVPGPAVIAPQVQVRRGPGVGLGVLLVGVGAALATLLGRRR